MTHEAVAAGDDEERDQCGGHAADAEDGHWLHDVGAAAGMQEDGSKADDGGGMVSKLSMNRSEPRCREFAEERVRNDFPGCRANELPLMNHHG